MAKTLSEKISQFLQVTLDSCAYAGKGDVLKVGSVSSTRPFGVSCACMKSVPLQRMWSGGCCACNTT